MCDEGVQVCESVCVMRVYGREGVKDEKGSEEQRREVLLKVLTLNIWGVGE